MAKAQTLTKEQARKIILHAAGLTKVAQFGKGIDGVYKAIEHLGHVQIDTISVVERAHHHAIWTRVPDYRHAWLDQLQADARIFEYWTYAVSFIPMSDYRFSLHVKQNFKSGRKPLTAPETRLMQVALDRISREGPLMARDFENDRVTKGSGWWDWRPSKLALERLYLDGSLMTIGRKSFQKIYDLPENIVPSEIDKTFPSDEEFAFHIITRALQYLGIAALKEIVYRHREIKSLIEKVIEEQIDKGFICKVQVTDVAGHFYMLRGYLKKKISVGNNIFILSPFDVVNIYRHRLRNFFDFDYQVECFVPKPKRKYGYFSLPILHGDKFIARMDSKAERKQKLFVVNNIHFESKQVDDAIVTALSDAIKSFATFNGCDTIKIKKSNSSSFLKAARKILS